MKMRFGILFLFVFLLAGCGVKDESELVKEKITELTNQAFSLNDAGKEFIPNLSQELVKDLIYQVKSENSVLSGMTESYDAISEGLTDGEFGKKVLCYKLPVTFRFNGDEENVKTFLSCLSGLDSKIVMNKFEIDEAENGFDVECLVCFIGESTVSGVGGSSNALSLVKKDKSVKEEEEIVLRNFDVNLTVRPSNSDAASVVLSTEAGNSLKSDENAVIGVTARFYKENGQFYCKYSVGDDKQTDKITVGSDVKFDILSCKKKLDTDAISVNLSIQNDLSVPVSVIIYNDYDNRVNITKNGSVEVTRK